MKNNSKPREFDAVLCGEAPPPVIGVVLGGIEGVKSRLKSSVLEVKIAALSEALNYGDMGLDLVINTLTDSSEQVQRFAARLLKRSGNKKVKQAVIDYDIWLFFHLLTEWKFENFDPSIGITNTIDTAYVLGYIEYTPFDFSQFEALLRDSQADKIQALVCQIWAEDYRNTRAGNIIKAISSAYKELTSLKTLFIGDGYDEPYKISYVSLGDVSPVLTAYPNLEVLQVRCDDSLEFSPLQHDSLKTLIVETGHGLSYKTIDQICVLELPNLEYLELWLGRDDDFHYEGINSGISRLIPLLKNQLFTKLEYLGLKSCEYADELTGFLVESPLIDNLKVLDLSRGKLTDKGAQVLLNCSKINDLHILNVSMNRLSPSMIEQLSQLNCHVEAEPQDTESIRGLRYWSLYE
ncbi:HEAT repeat domain-containing protein [uncultured Nostoc sp.]|uniref:HEAT repeat domain-containing protein n=1 Tax=uncultured Nostoc sp. TaxID=340711 RepID=UPI0035CA0FC1